ncbi:hypothetical protein [Convivina praedatoris]|uniref:hypothetical protein n=1 Tax=Convivina praedatoris TaxID=2880963 RepID=UPI00200C3893|nr:hypothetical protein [Convivina sp. LMG 32447]
MKESIYMLILLGIIIIILILSAVFSVFFFGIGAIIALFVELGWKVAVGILIVLFLIGWWAFG